MDNNENNVLKLYVSPEGRDDWSGRRPEPSAEQTDGPLATLNGIQRLLRLMKTGKNYDLSQRPTGECLSGPVIVYLREGVYAMKSPLILSVEDSWPITFKPYRDEKPVITGGERITGWKTTTVNRKTAWVVDLPEVAEGKWEFRQLFVNGRRAERPRLPKKGLFRMKEVPGMKLPAGWGGGGQTQFICNPGEVRPFRNLSDVEVVYLHYWIEERSGIAAFDPKTNLVTMQRPSVTALVGKSGSQFADYYLDNVFEELSEPGEWYLDRKKGQLYYLPRKGEKQDKTVVIAPRCLQLLALIGKPEENQYVEHIRFEGVRFAHTDWRHPDPSDGATFIEPDASLTLDSHKRRRGAKAGAYQASSDVPGVICLEGARFCAIERCIIEHIGWYGVEIADACHGIRVVGNTIRDMGAGGVKINGAAAGDQDVKIRQTGHHQVTDNEIAHGGRVFHSAVGILSMHAHTIAICHNHIHDLFYSGVSCGWEWGYQENVSRDNLIAFNHIHDIGQKLLSDMGGIYMLGVQPGTILRNNLIYNVSSADYGGRCIYPDAASSHLLIENNVCYDADREMFHQGPGRENIVRNNIWAFGGEAVVRGSQWEQHRGFTLLHNIMVSNGEPIFSSGYTLAEEAGRIYSDLNLFYAVKGKLYFAFKEKKMTLKQWQAMGQDLHSIVADPKFRNLNKRDFRLAADSPALKLGFVPIDLSAVGPRRSTPVTRSDWRRGSCRIPIHGDASLSPVWKVFAPLAEAFPPPTGAQLLRVPEKLTVAGRELAPIAVKVKDSLLDLAGILGGTDKGKTAWIYIPFQTNAGGKTTLGFGADWWLQAWVDGKLVCDTLAMGNGPLPPSVTDHMATINLARGAHLAVVRFVSGAGSSLFAAAGPAGIRKAWNESHCWAV